MAALEELPDQDARDALERVEHIIVVMMENRSFDHMLGYLSLTGRADVEGLSAVMANQHNGATYPVFPLARTDCAPWEDPDHSGPGVVVQLKGGNGGFVKSYIESRPEERRAALAADPHVLVMG
jgi:phospholipase C